VVGGLEQEEYSPSVRSIDSVYTLVLNGKLSMVSLPSLKAVTRSSIWFERMTKEEKKKMKMS
jgi:hypothetical protein